jgi:hypothetical protein
MHAVSLTQHSVHNQRTIRAALAAFKGTIYQNTYSYVPELSYHTTTKAYMQYLKGLPNKKNRFLYAKIDHISANSKQN